MRFRRKKAEDGAEKAPKPRKKKEPIVYNGIPCDSDEEKYFLMWAFELKKQGLISGISRANDFTLFDGLYETKEVVKKLKTKTSVKNVQKTVLAPTIYTPDFVITWTDSEIFFRDMSAGKGDRVSVVEVKPDFDEHNMTRLAIDKCKWLWQVQEIFVNICKMPSFFKETFTPVEYLVTNKTKQARKVKWEVRTCEEYLLTLKEKNDGESI